MSQTKNKTQLQLVQAAGKQVNKDNSGDNKVDFSGKLLRLPDPEKAAAMIAEHTGLEFDIQHPEQVQYALEQPELDASHQISTAKLNELEEVVNTTPQYIKACAENSGTDKDKVAFSDWAQHDQIALIFIAIALIAALVMSASNVYANLMSSGEAVYLEQPWIAVMISLLAPAASIAIKFMGHAFERYSSIKRYTHTIYTLTAFSFIAWIGLFALNYSGVTGGIDWDMLGDSNGNSAGSALVFTQLLTEILVGGTLFLAAQDIALKYTPELYRENLAYMNAVKARDEHLKGHTALTEKRNRNHIRLTQLKAERQTTINRKLADFIDLSTRFNSINRP